MKSIRISALAYEMLLELSKKNKKKPDDFIEMMIKDLYQGRK
jgi:hypothetical protein